MTVLKGLMEVVNPKGGQGLGETLILITLIVGMFVLSFYGKEIPEIFKMVTYAIVGAIWGYKVKQNEPKKGSEEGDV